MYLEIKLVDLLVEKMVEMMAYNLVEQKECTKEIPKAVMLVELTEAKQVELLAHL
jgi:hypothetical protein